MRIYFAAVSVVCHTFVWRPRSDGHVLNKGTTAAVFPELSFRCAAAKPDAVTACPSVSGTSRRVDRQLSERGTFCLRPTSFVTHHIVSR